MGKLFCAPGREVADWGKKQKKNLAAKQRARLSRETRIDFDSADDGVSTLKAEAGDGGGGHCRAALTRSEAGVSHRASLAIRQKTIRETTAVSF